MVDTNTDTKGFWDSWWKRVDEEEDWEDRPSLFAQFALSYFPASGSVLELGAGLGKDSRYFASYGYKVTCSDFSDEALRISQMEAINQKLVIDHVNLDLKYPFQFEDQTFDIVYSHAVLHYFSHKITDQILAEIYRVLKDGGVFATLLKSKEDPEIERSLKLEENFYRTPNGLVERFFNIEELEVEIHNLFKPVVMDSSEQMHEIENATFIRFIGTKIPKNNNNPL